MPFKTFIICKLFAPPASFVSREVLIAEAFMPNISISGFVFEFLIELNPLQNLQDNYCRALHHLHLMLKTSALSGWIFILFF